MAHLILASKSKARQNLLDNAGLAFQSRAAEIDERAIEASLGSDILPIDLALILATAKATAVSEQGDVTTSDYILAADQVLEDQNGDVLHKAATMEDARRRLLHLSGQTHQLHSALALIHNGEIVWSHVETAYMTMRSLSPQFVGRHMSQVGDTVLGSVGCYQIEGPGIQLFEKIDGDYYTIIGMPLLPLLNALRRFEVIDA